MSRVTLLVNDVIFTGKVQTLLAGLTDASPLMREWGEIAHASITENFEVGGRPRWRRLSAVTIKKKGHDRPLIGRTGNLANITVRTDFTSVQLGTHPSARAYASIQHFGGQTGRNQSVRIPARPYMVLQAEDEGEMRSASIRYFRRLGA